MTPITEPEGEDVSENAISTVDELLSFFPGTRHAKSRVCPGCGGDLSRTALVKLAYVFTPCDCGAVEYSHLYEQLWHVSHLSEVPSDAR